jgi:glycosyltransferase involved in cell wall biosynthesis
MQQRLQPVDIVMAGTFAAWRLGTLQARALPFARELRQRGITCAIVTVPWDMPAEAGVTDVIDRVMVTNTPATGVATFPLAVAQQARTIRALRPKAVHVFKPKGYGGLAGRAISSSTPLVVDSDDWEGDGGWNRAGSYSVLQRRLFDWQERTLLRDATAVTAASQLLVHRARTLRTGAPDRVTWVSNGLTDEWANRLSAACDPARAIGDRTLTVVLYSRFAEFGPDWLPRFLAALSDRLTDSEQATVRVIGDTPPDRIGHPNLVLEQMGYVAHNQIPDMLGEADIAVFPYSDSLIARSKNSVKLLELMAAGCAIVASSVGDVPAVAGNCAVMLDGAEPESFAQATVELARDRERVQRLSMSARQRAVRQFSIAASTHRLINAYRQAGVLTS